MVSGCGPVRDAGGRHALLRRNRARDVLQDHEPPGQSGVPHRHPCLPSFQGPHKKVSDLRVSTVDPHISEGNGTDPTSYMLKIRI